MTFLTGFANTNLLHPLEEHTKTMTKQTVVASPIRSLSAEAFRQEVRDQGLGGLDQAVFKCPMCGTLQSAADLIDAGAGLDFEGVRQYLGYSCVGRFTGAGSPRKKPDGQPCNWSLGGLFRMHKLEVVTPDGRTHPHFEPASLEEAQEHKRQREAKASPSEEN